MNTLEAIAARKSVRSYIPKQIPEEALKSIIKAGESAPVGSNAYNSMHISVIQNDGILNQIGEAVTELVFKILHKKLNKNFGAPTMIIVSGEPSKVPGVEYANAGTILENMSLAAVDQGIDSVIWGGAATVIDQIPGLRQTLGIPDGQKPLLAISLGYAAKEESHRTHNISVTRVS